MHLEIPKLRTYVFILDAFSNFKFQEAGISLRAFGSFKFEEVSIDLRAFGNFKCDNIGIELTRILKF